MHLIDTCQFSSKSQHVVGHQQDNFGSPASLTSALSLFFLLVIYKQHNSISSSIAIHKHKLEVGVSQGFGKVKIVRELMELEITPSGAPQIISL